MTLTDQEKMIYRRTIPGTLGDLCNAREMAKTADGRQELKNKGFLRDEQHWEFFDAHPETILTRARVAFDEDPLHRERFNKIVAIHPAAEDTRVHLGAGYIDSEVLTVDGRSLVKGPCPTGFVIPIYSGLGVLVGLDLVDLGGDWIEGYSPPDGLFLPSGEANPFERVLDLRRNVTTPSATMVVSGWQSLLRATAIEPGINFVGRTSSASVYNDIAEMMAIRPVLVGRWHCPPEDAELDEEIAGIVGDLLAVGYPPPPSVSWAQLFGTRSDLERALEWMGEEVDPE